jgi:hypothetical protein
MGRPKPTHLKILTRPDRVTGQAQAKIFTRIKKKPDQNRKLQLKNQNPTQQCDGSGASHEF